MPDRTATLDWAGAFRKRARRRMPPIVGPFSGVHFAVIPEMVEEVRDLGLDLLASYLTNLHGGTGSLLSAAAGISAAAGGCYEVKFECHGSHGPECPVGGGGYLVLSRPISGDGLEIHRVAGVLPVDQPHPRGDAGG